MKVLITGVAGFIGFHLAKKLLDKKIKVIGIDNLNNYYETSIKLQRLKILKKYLGTMWGLVRWEKSGCRKQFLGEMASY